jgi:hypothetical protein
MGKIHNIIESENQLREILNNEKIGNYDLFTCKPYKDCFDKYNVTEITDGWNTEEIKNVQLNPLTIVSLTMEYLMFPLLDDKVQYHVYKKILDKYTTDVVNSDYEKIFTLSAKALIDIGYQC